MAGFDYKDCDKCGERVFYDADLCNSGRFDCVGAMIVLCKKCAEKYKIVICSKNGGADDNDSI